MEEAQQVEAHEEGRRHLYGGASVNEKVAATEDGERRST